MDKKLKRKVSVGCWICQGRQTVNYVVSSDSWPKQWKCKGCGRNHDFEGPIENSSLENNGGEFNGPMVKGVRSPEEFKKHFLGGWKQPEPQDEIRGGRYPLLKSNVEILIKSDIGGASLSPIDFETIAFYESRETLRQLALKIFRRNSELKTQLSEKDKQIESLKCCGNCSNCGNYENCDIDSCIKNPEKDIFIYNNWQSRN